jgi:hypothetical protein
MSFFEGPARPSCGASEQAMADSLAGVLGRMHEPGGGEKKDAEECEGFLASVSVGGKIVDRLASPLALSIVVNWL